MGYVAARLARLLGRMGRQTGLTSLQAEKVLDQELILPGAGDGDTAVVAYVAARLWRDGDTAVVAYVVAQLGLCPSGEGTGAPHTSTLISWRRCHKETAS